MAIPPDTRAPGDDHHVEDHNAISDVLTAQAATLAGLGTAATQPASAFAAVFSPLTYGAAGNGTADDTTAAQAAFAAAGAAHGVVDLGNYRFKTTAPIILPSGITVRGGTIQGSQASKGAITNNTTDLFQFASGGASGSVTSVRFDNVSLDASAGHIFNMGPSGTLNLSAFTGCAFTQNGTGYAIFYSQTGATLIANFFGLGSIFTMTAAATVPAIYLISGNNAINDNTWQDIRFAGGRTTTVPFARIENTVTSGYCSGNVFRNVECEQLDAGILALYGCSYTLIENVKAYDTATFTGSLFTLGTTTGTHTIQTTIRNSGSIGGAVTGSVYHVLAGAGTGQLLLDNVGGESGTANLSIQPLHTTIINAIGTDGITTPVLSASGLAGATAGARLAGGTASGAPASGTFITGDVVADQTGALWVCTSGGTPGTWARRGAPDIQWFTAGGTWTKPAGAKTVAVTLLGGGCGGGSGRRGAAATIRCGGGGGGAGSQMARTFDAADLTSTVTVTIGAGGTGGTAVTADDTSGNNGASSGTTTSFGGFFSSGTGAVGSGGTATTGSAGAGPLGGGAGTPGAGANASTSGGAGVGVNPGIIGPPGGPSGGGITSGNTAGAGAAGGTSALSGNIGAGAAGVVDSTAPTSGTAPAPKGSPGPSAGSGAASITTTAQAGADAAANTGAGGSGGGASLNGSNSGAGGKGGSGWALVISYF